MIMDQEITLSKNLEILLKQKSLSQTTIARKLSINKSTFHNYLNGIEPRSLITLLKIAKFFDVTLDQLVFGSPLPIDTQQTKARHIDLSQEQRFEITIKPL